ncbi:hypothetical protein ZEAMMB73_Zm00001d004787 [Zea mays]|uniref:Uncharacterized protein n=1 Tax=Zea mays TaxID=4577 RepID=A0A1D6EHI2_MAIZE|nr:hypothetical protein ZEAMMB73_Zm00001d004787 [Zea mays]
MHPQYLVHSRAVYDRYAQYPQMMDKVHHDSRIFLHPGYLVLIHPFCAPIILVNLSIELDLLLFCMFGLHGITWHGIYL